MAANEIHLTDEDRAIIEQALATGEYENAGQVVSAALHALVWSDASAIQLTPAALDKVREGFAQIDRGEYVELNSPEDIHRFMDDLSTQDDGKTGR